MRTMPYSGVIVCLGTIDTIANESVNGSHSENEGKFFPFLCLAKNIYLIFIQKNENW